MDCIFVTYTAAELVFQANKGVVRSVQLQWSFSQLTQNWIFVNFVNLVQFELLFSACGTEYFSNSQTLIIFFKFPGNCDFCNELSCWRKYDNLCNYC